jgi:hypothetical protein
MIHSGEGTKVDLWTQVPLTQVIETLKYWGCRGGVKDFRRAFGRGVRRSSKWNRGRNWRQGSGYRKGHVRGFRFVREGCPCAHENVFKVKGGIKRMGLEHSVIIEVESAPESGVAFIACQEACCYVTVGTFTRHGFGFTAVTLRSRCVGLKY